MYQYKHLVLNLSQQLFFMNKIRMRNYNELHYKSWSFRFAIYAKKIRNGVEFLGLLKIDFSKVSLFVWKAVSIGMWITWQLMPI